MRSPLHPVKPLPALALVLSLIAGNGSAAGPPADDSELSNRLQELLTLSAASDYEEVLTRGETLLADLRRQRPDGSADEAEVLEWMVHACYRGSRVMDEAAPGWAARAVALREIHDGPASAALANSLTHQANLLSRRSDPEAAIPIYERAVGILAAASPAHDAQLAATLNSLSTAYRRLAEYDEALTICLRALAIQERILPPKHPDLATTLNNLAVVHTARGEYEEARRLHERALPIREAAFGPDHEWVAETLNNLANTLGYLGEYDEALQVQERALAIFSDRLGTDHQRTWWAKLNLGIAYLDMGDYRGALPICEEVLADLRERYGPDFYELCYALDALAASQFGLGAYGAALALYEESLRIAELHFGADSPENADTIEKQGRCLTALGRLDEAVARLSRSLELQSRLLAGDSPALCELLNSLSEAHRRRGEAELARAHAARSREIASRNLGDDHPLLAAATLQEAKANWSLGDTAAALAGALKAESVSRHHLRRTACVLPENRALDYAASRIAGLDLALSLLADREQGERTAMVWNAVIRSRSAVLDEYTARNRVLYDAVDPQVTALVDSSLTLRKRLASIILRGPGSEDDEVYRRLLVDTEAGLDAVERSLSVFSAEHRRRRAERQIGWPQVQDRLAAGEALVAFVRYRRHGSEMSAEDPDAYKVFVGRSGAAPVAIELGAAAEIDGLVRAWQDEVRFGTRSAEDVAITQTRGFVRTSRDRSAQLAAYLAVAGELRRRVWDPVRAELTGAPTVFVVADGTLNLVSFTALPDFDDHYLLESGPSIHLLLTERALAETPAPPSAHQDLVAVGNPDYDLRPASAAAAIAPAPPTFDFRPLPQAQREVDLIRDLWIHLDGACTNRVHVLIGAAATEAALQRDLHECRVLHLATHGFFLSGEVGADDSVLSRWRNPLLRAGLALAGANSGSPGWSEDDGILTAAEVAALDLHGVEWAVLSACDTGLGAVDQRGEGVFGLRRAFTLAGARTVIMSLWSVPDAAARDWMEALYQERWRRGASTIAAVRAASLAVLNARRAAGASTHPHYWAGFVATGDWR